MERLSITEGTNEKDEGIQNGGFEACSEEIVKVQAEVEEVDEEDTGRQKFSKPIEFLLSIISMSVGLGNFYRFPFVAITNGGGAFLIPYLIVLFVIGKPMYFLELTLGQFSSYGQVKCWKISPILKGVGFGSAIARFCVVSYYVSIMALTVFYFFSSFQATLPWVNCKESWAYNCSGNYTGDNAINLPELYFENEVLKYKKTIDDGIGWPEWRLSLCLLFSWLAVFFSIIKGVKSLGKVSYFTAIFPYIVLLIFLITGLTREGSVDGIIYFIEPQWDKIGDPSVWFAAIGQCFFSLSVGTGPVIMFASYNPFRHNIYRDALIVSVMDTLTSLLSGFTVFAILGNLAHELGVDITEVAKSGPALIFVSYADALSKFDYVPQLFAVLFFLMLFSLGAGSAVSSIMAVITVICDQFPKIPQFYVTCFACAVSFLFGLVYVTPGGQHVFTLVDHFAGTFSVYVLVTFEVIGVVWVYGFLRYCKDMEFMLNIKIGFYWKLCWGFITPVGLLSVLIYFLVEYQLVRHEPDYAFPVAGSVSGLLIAVACIGCIPLCAFHAVWTSEGKTIREKILRSIPPAKDWGPRNKKVRADWLEYRSKLEKMKFKITFY